MATEEQGPIVDPTATEEQGPIVDPMATEEQGPIVDSVGEVSIGLLSPIIEVSLEVDPVELELTRRCQILHERDMAAADNVARMEAKMPPFYFKIKAAAIKC